MKEFKVGDKVWCPKYGNGEVFHIVDSHNDDYPVEVEFADWRDCYTADGKDTTDDLHPTLFHGHDLILEAKEQKKIYTNIYWMKHSGFYIGANCHSTREEAIRNCAQIAPKYITTVELPDPALFNL